MMLEDLLTEIAESGWLFNNCYQADAGLWRVNLRRQDNDGVWFTEWSEAPTFTEAVQDAMEKLVEAEFVENRLIAHAIDTSKISLLASLGLLKPTEPLKRRV